MLFNPLTASCVHASIVMTLIESKNKSMEHTVPFPSSPVVVVQYGGLFL